MSESAGQRHFGDAIPNAVDKLLDGVGPDLRMFEGFVEFQRELCHDMIEVCRAKNHDYADATGEHAQDDPYRVFRNFRAVEDLGICDAETGFLVRLTDKFMRTINLVRMRHEGRDAAVSDETLRDTLARDLPNYCHLLYGYLALKDRMSAYETVDRVAERERRTSGPHESKIIEEQKFETLPELLSGSDASCSSETDDAIKMMNGVVVRFGPFDFYILPGTTTVVVSKRDSFGSQKIVLGLLESMDAQQLASWLGDMLDVSVKALDNRHVVFSSVPWAGRLAFSSVPWAGKSYDIRALKQNLGVVARLSVMY